MILAPESSLGPAIVTRAKESEPTPEPIVPLPPKLPQTYVAGQSYGRGQLVTFQGSVYACEAARWSQGSPVDRVDQWRHVRAVAGADPVRGPVPAKEVRTKVPAFNIMQAYGRGDLVRHSGQTYRLLTRSSRGVPPDKAAEHWVPITPTQAA